MADITDSDVITTYAKATTALGMFDRLKKMAEAHEMQMREALIEHGERMAYLRQNFADNVADVITRTARQIDSLTVTGDDDDEQEDD